MTLRPKPFQPIKMLQIIGGVFFAVKRKDYYASTALEEKVATIAQEVENGAFEGLCDEECLDELIEGDLHSRSTAQ